MKVLVHVTVPVIGHQRAILLLIKYQEIYTKIRRHHMQGHICINRCSRLRLVIDSREGHIIEIVLIKLNTN